MRGIAEADVDQAFIPEILLKSYYHSVHLYTPFSSNTFIAS